VRGLSFERLVGLPFRGALEDSGDFGQEVAAPSRELAKFGHCSGFLGVGELLPPGVSSSCTRELDDEDPVRGGAPAILIHLDRIEHKYGKNNRI
jgi:hypothetical protein